MRLYDAQLELAGANQEKFVFGLHGFYNNVVSKVKKAGKQQEFAEFWELYPESKRKNASSSQNT